MIRTQIQLTEKQSVKLKSISIQKGISVAELIRQSIEQFIETTDDLTIEEKYKRALDVVGKYSSDVTDLSENHDKYLAEAYAVVGE